MNRLVNLNDLMLEQLRELYDGELKIHTLLNKLQEYASHPRLTTLIQHYIDLNEDQQLRIRQVFEMLFTQKRGERAEPIQSMIRKLEELVIRSEDLEIMDAVLIVNLQHIIHYKIAGYGAICTYLKHLGMLEAAEILHQNLEVEKNSDRQFAMIADSFIDREAIAPMS